MDSTDSTKQQEAVTCPSSGYSAPPSQSGQDQPWKKWFSSESLDTDKVMEEDKEPQQRQGQTDATTNMG